MEGIEAIIYRAYPEDARILRKHVDDKESEIRNLRQQLAEKDVQLARCVGFINNIGCGTNLNINKFLNSLPDSAKQDAEILRCAKGVVNYTPYKLHPNFCEWDVLIDRLTKAVRASEERK